MSEREQLTAALYGLWSAASTRAAGYAWNTTYYTRCWRCYTSCVEQLTCLFNFIGDFQATRKLDAKLEAKDVLPHINRTRAVEMAEKYRLLSLVTLAFDLDLQTFPSEGPNTSSV